MEMLQVGAMSPEVLTQVVSTQDDCFMFIADIPFIVMCCTYIKTKHVRAMTWLLFLVYTAVRATTISMFLDGAYDYATYAEKMLTYITIYLVLTYVVFSGHSWRMIHTTAKRDIGRDMGDFMYESIRFIIMAFGTVVSMILSHVVCGMTISTDNMTNSLMVEACVLIVSIGILVSVLRKAIVWKKVR